MMPNRTADRAKMLLKFRQQQEQVAQQAFDDALARAEGICQRIARLERGLASETRRARQRIADAAARPALVRHLLSAAEVRAAIAAEVAGLREADVTLRQRREELYEAMARRKAAGALCDRAARHRAVRFRRDEVRQSDETHAAHAARAGEQTG